MPFDTGKVDVDAVLAFHDVMRMRPKGVAVHIHSHVCLVHSEVLIGWPATRERCARMRGSISGNMTGIGRIERSFNSFWTAWSGVNCRAAGRRFMKTIYKLSGW